MSYSRLVVADPGAPEAVAIELARNTFVARPNADVLATGIEKHPKLAAFLNTRGANPATSAGFRDLCIVGAGASVDEPARLIIALPGAATPAGGEHVVELVIGEPVGEVLVVPGTGRTENGVHVLTREAFGRLRRAERIARRRPVRAVILSGWNGQRAEGDSEAVQMLAAWRGPDVPVLLDEAARTTAENALWAAALAEALGNVPTVRVVTAWVGALRLGLATLSAFRGTRIRPRLAVVWGRAQAASWRPALGGLVHLPRHLRAGRAVIACGVHDPHARL